MALGRPRAFDKDKALDMALAVFWERGYAGTSIADLTQALGINPPSLYAAFGNKEALFHQVLDRYQSRRDELMAEAFSVPSAREAMLRLLLGAADLLTDKQNPGGCLLVSGALAGDEECACVKGELAKRRKEGEALIRDRLRQAKREGDLPPRADPAALASFFTTIMQGMAVKAAGGATRKELRDVVATALQVWPR